MNNVSLSLNIVAFLAIGIGVGILSAAAWGFVVFGILMFLQSLIEMRRRGSGPRNQ
jgi:hypothetical protein